MTILTAAVKHNGVTYQVEFEQDRMNDEEMDDLTARIEEAKQATDDREATRLFQEAIARTLVSWDVADQEGVIYPITPDVFRELPTGFHWSVQKAITKRARDYKRESLGLHRGPKYTAPKPKRKKKGKSR